MFVPHVSNNHDNVINNYYTILTLNLYNSFQSNLRRMDAAVKLNKVILEKSADAEVVFINLPVLPGSESEDRNCIHKNFIEYLE